MKLANDVGPVGRMAALWEVVLAYVSTIVPVVEVPGPQRHPHHVAAPPAVFVTHRS